MAYFIDGIEYTNKEYKIKLKEVQAHVALINDYVSKVQSGVITLEDVPAEYYDEIYERLNPPEPEPEPQLYTLDEAATILAQEVSQ